ncbi:hypothetical protein ACOSQ2_014567 [Xanthoceras sorbifolium]
MELLTLSEALNPIDDFTGDNINTLKRELGHYKFDIPCQPQFQNIASLSELCRLLVQSKRSQHYFSIDRFNNRTSIFNNET